MLQVVADLQPFVVLQDSLVDSPVHHGIVHVVLVSSIHTKINVAVQLQPLTWARKYFINFDKNYLLLTSLRCDYSRDILLLII